MGGTAYPALDGKDNVIQPHHITHARGCDWCALVNNLIHTVVQLVNENVGTAHDVRYTDASDTPILRLPSPANWVPKEVETYFEFDDDSAVARVHDIADRGSAIAANFSQTEYQVAVAPGQARTGNSFAARFGLGAKGIELLIYAKARDRVRAEIRYSGNTLKAAGIVRAQFDRNPETFWREVLRSFTQNAERRLNRLASAYAETLGSAEPRRHRLAMLLANIAHACEGEPRLTMDVISLILANRGFTLGDDAPLARAIQRLVIRDVLRPNRSGIRARRTEFAISPFYNQTLDILRRLEPLLPD